MSFSETDRITSFHCGLGVKAIEYCYLEMPEITAGSRWFFDPNSSFSDQMLK